MPVIARFSPATAASKRSHSYFRHGNSDHSFDKISHYTTDRLARFVGKRHKRGWGYGMKVIAYQSPNRLGLINLNGTIVAPRPNRPWRPGR